jgi:prophage tail gpP-like protein
MTDFAPSPPNNERVVLQLPDADIELAEFTEYSFVSNFLEPSDRFSFTIGASSFTPAMSAAVQPGAAVKLSINGLVQASGYIDSVEKSASRGSGMQWRIEGRDRLGQVVDACADPTKSLTESMTLLEGMKTLFKPFGWTQDDQFIESNETNQQLRTGVHRRHKFATSDAKGFGRRAIKSAKLHQLRPNPREGVFEFASRISQRFGLWIWTSADGEKLIVGQPAFDVAPYYKIVRTAQPSNEAATNVLEGAVKFDLAEQPTHIVADAHTHGGEFGWSRTKVILINTAVQIRNQAPDYIPPAVQKYKDAGAVVLPAPVFSDSATITAPQERILYLNDGESQTVEHLAAFAFREMALLQRRSLSVHYKVEGHGQVTEEGFVPWTIDTTVDVDDEVAGLKERLYVLGRTFSKSRSGGTTTDLELIRLHSLSFTSTGK